MKRYPLMLAAYIAITPAVAADKEMDDKRPRPVLDSRDDKLTSNCGKLRKCNEIGTCAEARKQLIECGNAELDRDRDGIPCESICQ